MHRLLPAILLLALTSQPLAAQITLTNADFPVAGGMYRFSNGMLSPAIDPVPTGAAHTWDFSFLQHTSQDVDTFVTVSSTGPTYAFIFADISFNTNRANMALRGGALPPIPLGGVTISDVISFYYKSSTGFLQVGYGASVNGLGIPITFDSKDKIYKLPMQYGDTDSSYSSFQISIPNLGYYGHEQNRVSEVDGWGSLTTPYGTFNVLRLRSVITAHDSLYADTLGIGFGFSPPVTVEYKWLGAGQFIPLLQINTTMVPFGGETVTSVVYKDSLRLTGTGELLAGKTTLHLFPNPSNGSMLLNIDAAFNEKASVKLFNAEGKLLGVLWSGNVYSGNNKIALNTSVVNAAAGFYILDVDMGGHRFRERVVITGNQH